jgi:hypothetical protein
MFSLLTLIVRARVGGKYMSINLKWQTFNIQYSVSLYVLIIKIRLKDLSFGNRELLKESCKNLTILKMSIFLIMKYLLLSVIRNANISPNAIRPFCKSSNLIKKWLFRKKKMGRCGDAGMLYLSK